MIDMKGMKEIKTEIEIEIDVEMMGEIEMIDMKEEIEMIDMREEITEEKIEAIVILYVKEEEIGLDQGQDRGHVIEIVVEIVIMDHEEDKFI